jgi:hypothetical protein
MQVSAEVKAFFSNSGTALHWKAASPPLARRSVPLAAVDISGKMGYSDAQRQTKEHRMDIAAEFMAAATNAFEANKRLAVGHAGHFFDFE